MWHPPVLLLLFTIYYGTQALRFSIRASVLQSREPNMIQFVAYSVISQLQCKYKIANSCYTPGCIRRSLPIILVEFHSVKHKKI